GRDGGRHRSALDPGQPIALTLAAALDVEIAPDAGGHGQDDQRETHSAFHRPFDVKRGVFVYWYDSLPPAASAVETVEGDPIVGQGLSFGVLRLGEGELGIGQLEDRPDASVEPALGKSKVLLGRGHRRLSGLDSLGCVGDRYLGLLDVLDDVELGRLDVGQRAFVVGPGLAVAADAPSAIVDGPGERERDRPQLVQVLTRTTVRSAARDVREEVAEGL